MSHQATTSAIAPLTPETARAGYAELERELSQLAGPEAWIAFYRRWNTMKTRIAGERARRDFHEAQDTRDHAAEESARQMREAILPIAEEANARIRAAVLASPHRDALERQFGSLLFRVLENEQQAFHPSNIALNVKVGDLAAGYERILGGAQVTVNGEAITLPRAYALFSHPDEATRRAAWGGVAEWMLAHAREFHAIYGEMAGLRHQMARNLGRDTYVPVAYSRMNRLDYGPREVAAFREAVKRHIVPLHRAWRTKQAKLLGQPTVKPWNMMFYPGLSLPPGVAPITEQLDRGQALFDRLHPTLGDHFRRMRAEGLIDLENRPGKRPGAFCNSFDDQDVVVIFCNSTGDEQDVATLTHEMGHAFMGWESRWIEPVELKWPTLEACEVHSMGMEFLSLRHLDTFFSPEDAAKFRKLKLIDTITLLPYIAVVDAFQHWVYEHPGHTSAERDAVWCELWDEYMGGLDFSEQPEWKATRWKRQAHIFVDPFYYIDYGIAETGALQLWQKAEQDPAAAMDVYLKLCHLGGSLSLQDLFRSAGLVSPFEPDALAPAAEAIRTVLEL